MMYINKNTRDELHKVALTKALHHLVPEVSAHFTDATLDAILSISTLKKYHTLDFVLKAGDQTQELSLNLLGVYRIFYLTSDGEEYTRTLCQEGDVVTAFSSVLEKSPSKVYIQALTDGELLQINYTDLINLFPDLVVWQVVLRKFVERHYLYKENREYELLMLDAKSRFERFLKDFPGLLNRIAQKYVAQYVNVTPEHLSRLRAKRDIPLVPNT